MKNWYNLGSLTILANIAMFLTILDWWMLFHWVLWNLVLTAYSSNLDCNVHWVNYFFSFKSMFALITCGSLSQSAATSISVTFKSVKSSLDVYITFNKHSKTAEEIMSLKTAKKLLRNLWFYIHLYMSVYVCECNCNRQIRCITFCLRTFK